MMIGGRMFFTTGNEDLHELLHKHTKLPVESEMNNNVKEYNDKSFDIF